MPGQGAAVSLTGVTQKDAVVAMSVSMYVVLEGGDGSRARTLGQLKEIIEDARAWGLSKAAWEKGDTRTFALGRRELQAMLPVLDGRLPMVVETNRAVDIEALLRLTDETDINLIIQGGAEAHLMAKELAARQVPVIVDAIIYGPGHFDQLRARPDNAALLQEAGVPLVICPTDDVGPHRVGILRQNAGNAVRGGLDHAAAVKAITQAPADAFGLDGYGRIAVGAHADLVLWAGDPLEIGTTIEAVYIDGVVQDLTTRQSRLLDRYRSLPASPSSLPLP